MDKEFSQNVLKAQMDINQYLDDILLELELNNLPDTEKKQMKRILMTALEKFFIGTVMEKTDDQQMDRMNNLITEDEGLFKLMDYIAQNFDQDGKMLSQVLIDFKVIIVEKMKSKELNNE